MTDPADSDAGIYRTFRSLVDAADRKFAPVHSLPSHRPLHHPALRKVFKAYTRLWRFQQANRRALVAAGMRRSEIGEIASRIGQLYYAQYQRTSESRFLIEAYVFYEAVLSRRYFEEVGRVDLGLRGKEMRFCARFLVVALLVRKMEVVRQLVERFKGLLEDCKVSFPGTTFKEWKLVLQEIGRFLKADSDFPYSRPLRYNVLFDSHPSSQPCISRFHPPRILRLQDAVLTGYHRNEVKFSELTLDAYRMLQSLEWEPSGFFYQRSASDLTNNGGYSDQSGTSGLIDINLSEEIIDSTLPPNPHKTILYRPSVSKLIAVIAAICEELSVDSVLLIYISCAGNSDQNIAFQKENGGAHSNMSISSQTRNKSTTVMQQARKENADGQNSYGSYLWLSPRGSSCVDKLYPADLIPFTRRPLFLIIDSDCSNAFKIIHGQERGEAAAFLLSPMKLVLPNQSASDLTSCGSQFTYFLTAPLQAFCQLLGLSDVGPEAYSDADSALSTALSNWEVTLFKSGSLDQVWAQLISDPFLRRLILRFIFCRAILFYLHLPDKSSDHLPCCLPELPESVSPNSSSVKSSILPLTERLGVSSHFNFTNIPDRSSHVRSS